MRVLLTLILCLAIPLQGFASASAAEPPCPMAQGLMELAAEAHAAFAPEHDCCNDADTAAQTGKLCKTGQECPAGHAAVLAAGIGLIPEAAPVARVPVVASAPLSFHPPGVWRPPALA